ncbi:MAG: transcription antitermination factor NusB [Archangium gephyra]|uniref:Transcription antitermination protein NusB n=1 Tax=Archangium gephyra TaxID=48 RepID=A0A2W5VQJ2_9BACT|nr:MAG: transcription antitermination factor NusB [Archangium gephyra]
MGARRIGRERALQALYQMEQDGKMTSQGALDAAWTAHDDEGPRDPAADSFARDLIEGVTTNKAKIDELIESHSHNWRLERMQRIDRNVLRIGVYELQHLADVPRKVTINEAVELAKTFGNEASSAFINGLLDRIASTVGKE